MTRPRPRRWRAPSPNRRRLGRPCTASSVNLPAWCPRPESRPSCTQHRLRRRRRRLHYHRLRCRPHPIRLRRCRRHCRPDRGSSTSFRSRQTMCRPRRHRTPRRRLSRATCPRSLPTIWPRALQARRPSRASPNAKACALECPLTSGRVRCRPPQRRARQRVRAAATTLQQERPACSGSTRAELAPHRHRRSTSPIGSQTRSQATVQRRQAHRTRPATILRSLAVGMASAPSSA